MVRSAAESEKQNNYHINKQKRICFIIDAPHAYPGYPGHKSLIKILDLPFEIDRLSKHSGPRRKEKPGTQIHKKSHAAHEKTCKKVNRLYVWRTPRNGHRRGDEPAAGSRQPKECCRIRHHLPTSLVRTDRVHWRFEHPMQMITIKFYLYLVTDCQQAGEKPSLSIGG